MTMSQSLAVCLTTCDRLDYTERTLASFAAHNDLSRFVLLHGDDASTERGVFDLVRSYGFRSVVKHASRQGGHATRAKVLARVSRTLGLDWVLVLENDIESVRPFPWALFDFIRRYRGIYCLRLYGPYKDAHGRQACKTTHQWLDNQPVRWKPLHGAPEPVECGQIHWSAQPSVTRMQELLALYRGGERELRCKTARVLDNVMVHIGVERTAPVEIAS